MTRNYLDGSFLVFVYLGGRYLSTVVIIVSFIFFFLKNISQKLALSKEILVLSRVPQGFEETRENGH